MILVCKALKGKVRIRNRANRHSPVAIHASVSFQASNNVTTGLMTTFQW
jgi:hypothetical protein